MKRLLNIILFCFLLTGCTTIGIPDKEAKLNYDFGPVEKLRICIYKDAEVSDKQADEIISAMQKEFADFGLKIEVPWIKEWKRPGFAAEEIINNFASCALESPCDRLLALVGRNVKDFLWGIVMPEYYGMVEDVSRTKGFAIAEAGSLNQMLSSSNGARNTIHETFHFLGCEHGIDAKQCYDQIIRIKKMARKNRLAGKDFFPSAIRNKRVLGSRWDVKKELKPYLNKTFRCEVISETN